MKTDILATALRAHAPEVRAAVAPRPDWAAAGRAMDSFFAGLANPRDDLWSAATVEKLTQVYFSAREKDECSGNITLRTVAAMPAGLRDDTKKIFLRIAATCVYFNASHKVNFEPAELPERFPAVPMAAGKKKGGLTYAAPLPALYAKTSLTFDYWVPKTLEWVGEIRREGLTQWRGAAILQHESCTDFMRIALLFLADPAGSPPVAKQEEREALLTVLGEPFGWIKKSQKREDILQNNAALRDGLNRAADAAGLAIPLEAWSRLVPLPFMKSLLKK